MFSNIQFLRAYAAMLVVLHHALPHYIAMNGTSSVVKSIAAWGFTGVDIFFVISGFVIAHTTLTKERNITNCIEFIKHRLSRIYLGYWPFFIAACVLSLVNLQSDESTINLVSSFLLTSTDMNELVLPVSWSLSYELYFYAIFSVLFAIRPEIVKIILLVLFAATVLRAIYIPINHESSLSFFFSHFLIEFFSGTLIYIYRHKLKSVWLLPVFIAVAITAYSYGVHIEAKNGPDRVFTFGVSASAIVIIALLLEECGFYKAGRILTALGDSSYTLYLSHLIMLQLFYLSSLRLYFENYGPRGGDIGLIFFVAFCLISSHFFYRKVERPLYKMACSIRFPPMREPPMIENNLPMSHYPENVRAARQSINSSA